LWPAPTRAVAARQHAQNHGGAITAKQIGGKVTTPVRPRASQHKWLFHAVTFRKINSKMQQTVRSLHEFKNFRARMPIVEAKNSTIVNGFETINVAELVLRQERTYRQRIKYYQR
jgi:hypothetical protein